MRLLGLLGCALIAACARESTARTAKELVFTVDGDRARTLGWVSEGTDELQVAEAMAELIERRLPFDESATITPAAGEIRIEFARALPGFQADRIAAAVQSLGLLEMLMVADAERLAGLGTDYATEREKLSTWRAANPEVPLAAFTLVPAAEEGPDERIAWLPVSPTDDPQVLKEPNPVLLPADFEAAFGAAVFERVYYTQDSSGFPAVGFEFVSSVHDTFAEFTHGNVNGYMAIVVRDEVVSAPRIDERLPGAGIIRGRFTDAEVKALVASLRASEGPLRRVR